VDQASDVPGAESPREEHKFLAESAGESLTAQRIRVLLADDHVVIRAGTRRILEDEPDLLVVGEAGDGQEAIALAAATQPHVVLLDISMPTMDGIAASTELRRQVPHARLLVLTAYAHRAFVRHLNRLGASGYLLKSTAPADLIAAIRRVHAGEYVFDPTLMDQMEPNEAVTGEPTRREVQVLRELARGSTYREIAESLNLSPHTVEFHLRNLYGKLGAASASEALVSAQRRGWLDS
jgi:NarL family two-component system response regulator LiaR